MPRTSNRGARSRPGLVIRDLPRRRVEFPVGGRARRVSRDARHRRDRRHRHAEAHAIAAREGRAERLHSGGRDRERRRRRARHRAGEGGAVDGGTRSREGGELHGALRVDVRRLGAGRGIPARRARALPRRRLRLRHQAQHPAAFRRARMPVDRRARRDDGGSRARAGAGRRLPVERPGRPGAVHLRDPRDRDDRRRGRADVRHLPRPSIAGACVGRARR